MTLAPTRADELRAFAETALATTGLSIAPASADASFRSYWRVTAPERTFVVMDAPPEKENLEPWLDIGARLRQAGLHTPEVHAVDRAHGFVLMEDLGTRLYLGELSEATADALYADALDALHRMQTAVDTNGLPAFGEAFVTTELEIMPEWFLERHLGYETGCDDWDIIELAFRTLLTAVHAQPQTFMHRDYHSRNLLIAERNNPAIIAPGLLSPGIIDFQGAMLGPIAYDLASLLRDCYIVWPIERVDAWVEDYRQRLFAAGLVDVDGAHFRRWFDLIGLQRHIKVLGLFCRLNYRDGKPGYLADLPRVFDYVLSVARLYPDLTAFASLLERAVAGRDISVARPADSVAMA